MRLVHDKQPSHRVRGRRWRGGKATIVVAIITACLVVSVGTSAARERTTYPSNTMVLASFPGEPYFSNIVADKLGFFKRYNLTTKFVQPANAATALKLVATNGVNGWIGTDSNLFSLVASGAHVKAIGDLYNEQTTQLTIRAGDPILNTTGDWKTRLRALKGATIGVPGIGTGHDLVFRAALTQAGLDPDKDLHILSIASPTVAQAQFLQHAIDGYIYVPPVAATFQAEGVGQLYWSARDTGGLVSEAFSSLVVNAPWYAAHGSAVREWLKATEDAIAWVENPANTAAAVQLYADNLTGGNVQAAQSSLPALRALYKTAAPGLVVPRRVYATRYYAGLKQGWLDAAGAVAAHMTYSSVVARISWEPKTNARAKAKQKK